MQREAVSLGAAGVVGVRLVLGGHGSGAHTEEFLATGTAVRPVATRGRPATPQLVLGLRS